MNERGEAWFLEYINRQQSLAAAQGMQKSTAPKKNYPAYQDILQMLLSADEECKINFTLHFEKSISFEKTMRVLFGNNCEEVKDAVIVPDIPDPDDVISYKQIRDFLQLFQDGAVREFSNMYAERSARDDRERKNFIYCILVDESVPSKFLPYTYFE